jgi:oxalate decarboxylase
MTAKSVHVTSFADVRPAFESDLGSVTQLDAAALPILSGLAIQRIILEPGAIREPQWNVNANQLGYVAQGHARMRVLDPDGTLDEYELNPGDVYFVPRAYPHHIEDIGPDDINFLIFFDQPMPGDIGYRATASAFSREALAAGFGLRERDLPQFPFTPVDPLIVARVNPVDPVA